MGSTCGFNSLGQPRLAAPGFVCRVDTDNGLWGFCPSSVISASDCGLAGYCFDNAKCSTGCGPLANQQGSVTTFTCQPNFCSTIVSDNGLGQNYLYIGCGGKEVVETLYASPPSTSASTTFSTTASSTPQQSPTTSTVSSTTSFSRSPVTEAAFASSTITSSATTSSITTASSAIVPSATESASNASTSGGSSTPIGAIVGGVVGGIAMICLTVLAVILIRRKRASSPNTPSESHQDHPDGKGYRHPEDWPSYGSGPPPKPVNPSPPYEAYSREFHEADAIASPTELPAAEVRKIGGGSLKSPKSPAS